MSNSNTDTEVTSWIFATALVAALFGGLLLLFGDSDPASGSKYFRFVFIVLVLTPAGIVWLGLLRKAYTNTPSRLNSQENVVGIIAATPALLILPTDIYWEIWVMVAIHCTMLAVIWVRSRTELGERDGQEEAFEQTRALSPSPRQSDQNSGESENNTITYKAERARHKMSDLAGMQDMKDRLLAAAEEIRSAKGKKQGLAANARNGILLHGEPGNGKTAIAEGLAGTIGLPIIKMSFGSVASPWINNTTTNVVQLFKDARRQAPCVLFMDEIDSIAASREFSSNTTEEGPKITNTLLTELVNTRGKGVIIVMATNFLDRLDAAAVREGRVDFKIEVPPPDAPARRAIIKKVMADHDRNITCRPDALEQAVKRWEGFSAARISGIVDEAMRRAAKARVRSIDYKDLQDALRVMQGSHGLRITEDTPTLEALYMPVQQKVALLGVAERMLSIEEIERMGGTVPTGLLFAGQPGTGKTLTVRALAKTTDWPLLVSSGADLMADASRIDELIVKAKSIRPCIVFIDEADDVFSDRRMGSNFSAAVTNKLLTAMDGAEGKTHDILWVAAVNAPETMDPAALRGGRFTEKVWFENPDEDTVVRIVGQWLAKSKARFASDLTAECIADILAGESPANINAILQQSVNVMIGRSKLQGMGQALVLAEDLDAARLAVVGQTEDR